MGDILNYDTPNVLDKFMYKPLAANTLEPPPGQILPVNSYDDYVTLKDLSNDMAYKLGQTIDSLVDDEDQKAKLKQQIELQKAMIRNTKKKKSFLNGSKINEQLTTQQDKLKLLEQMYKDKQSQAVQKEQAQQQQSQQQGPGLQGLQGLLGGLAQTGQDAANVSSASQPAAPVPTKSVMAPATGPRKIRDEA
jgi:hypothetical protein